MGSTLSIPSPLDATVASALVDTFFDALGHFAGERPALDELGRLLAPDAQILEVEGTPSGASPEETSCYARDAWLARIAHSADLLHDSHQGHFFHELERTLSRSGSHLRVERVVEERVTREASVHHVETLFCSLLVGQVAGEPSIVEVRVRRGSWPPPR